MVQDGGSVFLPRAEEQGDAQFGFGRVPESNFLLREEISQYAKRLLSHLGLPYGSKFIFSYVKVY